MSSRVQTTGEGWNQDRLVNRLWTELPLHNSLVKGLLPVHQSRQISLTLTPCHNRSSSVTSTKENGKQWFPGGPGVGVQTMDFSAPDKHPAEDFSYLSFSMTNLISFGLYINC